MTATSDEDEQRLPMTGLGARKLKSIPESDLDLDAQLHLVAR